MQIKCTANIPCILVTFSYTLEQSKTLQKLRCIKNNTCFRTTNDTKLFYYLKDPWHGRTLLLKNAKEQQAYLPSDVDITELLQLSAITEDEKATFSEHILPSKPISSTASAIHNITVRYSGDQRQLYKDGKQIPATSLQTCPTRFLHFLKTIYNSKPVDHLVLTGHNSSVFDTPRLLRNGGSRFSNQLEEMKVLFCDSLPVFKFLRSRPNNALNLRRTTN